MKTSVSDRQARFSQFCDFCDGHPAMAGRFEEIVDRMGSTGDAIGTVDEAEDRIIEMSRGFNAQMLREWAAAQQDPALRRAGKKTLAVHRLRRDRH